MINSSSITSQTSHHVKPSIFDLVAQDSMSELIEPAFKKIIYFLSLKNPNKYGWMSKWTDECYLGFNFLVQKFCLAHCRASFSEFMYKLERIPSSGLNAERLPWKQEMLSLLCLTLLPHVRNKMKAKLTLDESEGLQMLYKIYKAACFFSSLSRLIHHLLYLTNRIESHSPLLTVCGLRLTYARDESISTNRFLNYLSTLIQVGAFTVQLLQTWYSSDSGISIGRAGTIPPPPPYIPPSNLRASNSCPVCKHKPSIPTVLATSGYVFCFQCIAERLQATPLCPVTGIASSIDDMIQVYSSAS